MVNYGDLHLLLDLLDNAENNNIGHTGLAIQYIGEARSVINQLIMANRPDKDATMETNSSGESLDSVADRILGKPTLDIFSKNGESQAELNSLDGKDSDDDTGVASIY